MFQAQLDPASGYLFLRMDSHAVPLTPLWLRERSEDPGQMDLANHQRLYDPTLLPADLRILDAEVDGGTVAVTFSDGHRGHYPLAALAVEAGLAPGPHDLPAPEPWAADGFDPPRADWRDLDRPEAVYRLLHGFFRTGVAILTGTPAEEDSLLGIAGRFGPIRETNWGRLFNVRSVAAASDLAYTSLALTAHTDNPYRRSVPGIQFLHCLANAASGGDSTLVDGLAIAERLRQESPEAFAVLSSLPVSFRYLSDAVSDRESAPLLQLGPDGRLRLIRLSTRLDFPPAVDPATLELFFAGRRRLAALAADPAFQARFRLTPGDCLMMDNHRTLHGRTAFAGDGDRFLQGCYIDHDGPESRYRILGRQLAGAQPGVAA